MSLKVELHDKATRAFTSPTEGAPNVLAATRVRADEAKRLFLERALHPKK